MRPCLAVRSSGFSIQYLKQASKQTSNNKKHSSDELHCIVFLAHDVSGWRVHTAWCLHPGEEPMAVLHTAQQSSRKGNSYVQKRPNRGVLINHLFVFSLLFHSHWYLFIYWVLFCLKQSLILASPEWSRNHQIAQSGLELMIILLPPLLK